MQKNIFWLSVIIVCVILSIVDVLLLNYQETILGMEWNWGWAAFFAQLLYAILSFRIVGPTELGARLFFGKPIGEVSSGLAFIPFLICQLKTETRLIIQDELPADPQHIWREPKGKEGGEIPKGYFPPIRVLFGFPRKKEDLKKLDIVFPESKTRE